MKRELNAKEAAVYCGHTYGGFRHKVKHIRHRKERGRLYFLIADLDAFIADRSTTHEPEVA